MGRSKPVFKKQKFKGNMYTKKKPDPVLPSNDKVSTSIFKVGNGLSDLCSGIDEDEVKTSGYRLIDISLLSTAINAFCLCSHCETVNCLKVKEESREGLASVMKIYCENCEHDY